jgi:guanosine-3',5'-bis(diphosphate) 3'-pyrophosphohydrolase
VTDEKTLPKADRKRLQVEHAAHVGDKAKLVKLADKIANVRDGVTSPPDRWDLPRRQEYFDWAQRVVDQLRVAHPVLEAAFEVACRDRPA